MLLLEWPWDSLRLLKWQKPCHYASLVLFKGWREVRLFLEFLQYSEAALVTDPTHKNQIVPEPVDRLILARVLAVEEGLLAITVRAWAAMVALWESPALNQNTKHVADDWLEELELCLFVPRTPQTA